MSGQTKKLLVDAARRAARYLDGLDRRAVAPSAEAVQALAALSAPLQEEPADPARVLRELDELGSPATMAMAGPRFFGFVIGGSLPASLAANVLAGAWDQNSAFASVTPGTAAFEQAALSWIVDLLGLPAGTGAGFVTGATVANFTALAAARHAMLKAAGWNVEADGLFGAPPVSVVVGEEAHSSLFKALGLLGLGRRRVIRVPADGQGRLRLDGLPAARAAMPAGAPVILCLQAGNVNTGSFDPVGDACDAVRAWGVPAWVHVDGAFGLWAAASPSLRGLAPGMDRADSWATDAHKWLNVPYDCGLAFVRDPEILRAAMAVTADYLPPPDPRRSPSDYVPELSRRARGVEVWAALRSLGRSGVAAMIERSCRQARRFAEGLAAAGFAVLNDVVLNQVLVSFGDGERTKRVMARIQEDGTCWCGGTVWQGKTAMRISLSSWATTEEDVEKSLAAMIRCAREAG